MSVVVFKNRSCSSQTRFWYYDKFVWYIISCSRHRSGSKVPNQYTCMSNLAKTPKFSVIILDYEFSFIARKVW